MKLLIAIPALNEEQSIESIITRSLAAKASIIANSAVTDVEITVVSDGSTDKTVEFARRFTGGENGINLIVFPKNRGYGAAIKEAWRRSDAELLGFLDADGTCDPKFFSSLCQVVESGADVVLGCRMNKNSQMPLIRRTGNLIFATLLRLLSSTRVRDTASGMRVVRREILPELEPLPDGLHFTPAMSARALLSGNVKIAEIDMPYKEREGESKLNPGRDGLRFLRVILEAAFLYRPDRPLALLGAACLASACALMAMPTAYYLGHGAVLEWMIYRFIVGHLAVLAGFVLLSASYLTGRMAEIALRAKPKSAISWLHRLMSHSFFWTVPFTLMFAGGLLVLPSFTSLIRTGATYEHWSRFIAMSLLFSTAIVVVVTQACDYVLDLLQERVAYLESRRVATEAAPSTIGPDGDLALVSYR